MSSFKHKSRIFYLYTITIVAFVFGMKDSVADKIYSPNTEYREISLEYNGSKSFDSNPDKDDAQQNEISLEAGISPRLEMELSSVYSKEPGKSNHLDGHEIEGRYQFFEPGEKWLDSGILVAYGISSQSERPNSLEIKLLLQKDTGWFTSTANIGFTRNIGAHSKNNDGPDYEFLFNTRYRYSTSLQPGLELQSDLGQEHQLGNFNEQEHQIGPAVYGKLFGHFEYQAAYLFGISDAAAQGIARLLVEYELNY